MKRKEQEEVRRMLALVQRIGNATGHTDMSLHGINVLFTAALGDLRGEPMVSKEIAEKVGISTSAVSRQIDTLGQGARGKPGLGLVSALPDMMDRRSKPVNLTAKGRKAVAAILEELG